MGVAFFCNYGTGSTAKIAFGNVRARFADNDAQGYSGTIAEKISFIMVGTAANRSEALNMAEKFLDSTNDSKYDCKISEKYGPAGCVAIANEHNKWLFFGWAAE